MPRAVALAMAVAGSTVVFAPAPTAAEELPPIHLWGIEWRDSSAKTCQDRNDARVVIKQQLEQLGRQVVARPKRDTPWPSCTAQECAAHWPPPGVRSAGLLGAVVTSVPEGKQRARLWFVPPDGKSAFYRDVLASPDVFQYEMAYAAAALFFYPAASPQNPPAKPTYCVPAASAPSLSFKPSIQARFYRSDAFADLTRAIWFRLEEQIKRRGGEPLSPSASNQQRDSAAGQAACVNRQEHAATGPQCEGREIEVEVRTAHDMGHPLSPSVKPNDLWEVRVRTFWDGAQPEDSERAVSGQMLREAAAKAKGLSKEQSVQGQAEEVLAAITPLVEKLLTRPLPVDTPPEKACMDFPPSCPSKEPEAVPASPVHPLNCATFPKPQGCPAIEVTTGHSRPGGENNKWRIPLTIGISLAGLAVLGGAVALQSQDGVSLGKDGVCSTSGVSLVGRCVNSTQGAYWTLFAIHAALPLATLPFVWLFPRSPAPPPKKTASGEQPGEAPANP